MGDKISTLFPDLVDVQYVYNVMDLGYKSEDILYQLKAPFQKGLKSAEYKG